MFTKLVSLGIIALQLSTIVFVVLWIKKSTFLKKIYKYSHIILPIIFISSALGSLVFEYGYGYEPCLLCWYQRIFIFGIAILSLTADIKTNKMLQKQQAEIETEIIKSEEKKDDESDKKDETSTTT